MVQVNNAVNKGYDMSKCNQVANKKTKKIPFIIYSDICGCNATIEIEYELNGKTINKTVCKKHYNSNLKWLNKINVLVKIKNI